MVRIFAVISMAALLSGCGWKHLLGSAPPPAKIVSNADSGSSSGANGNCPAWSVIYQGTEEQSSAAFECWVAKEPDIWKKIHGANPNELTEREIGIVVREGIVNFGEGVDKEAVIRKILAIKDFLGFGPTLTRAGADRWIDWARAHRANIRTIYQNVFPVGQTSQFKYSDAQLMALTAASFLREQGWTKSSAELAPIMGELLSITDPDMTAALEPGMRVFRNLMGFTCPLNSDISHINTVELAGCLDHASTFFIPGARWLEFMINNKNQFSDQQVKDVKGSIAASEPLVKAWFSQPHLNPLDTQLWFDWAVKMGAKPPANFIDSLKFLRRLKDKSTEKSIDPSEMVRVFSIIKEYEAEVLDGLPYYAKAFQTHDCLNSSATPAIQSWKDCVLKDSQKKTLKSIRDASWSIDMMYRVKDPLHGIDALPLNGDEFGTVTFFNAVAAQLIQIFDDSGKGVISADISNDHDDLVELIVTSIGTYQAVNHYLSNLEQRLSGKVARVPDDNIDLSNLDLTAFGKLVAMTHDVLVDRGQVKHNILQKAFALVLNDFPSSSFELDQIAITAVLTTITALPHYRETALQEILQDPAAVAKAMDENSPIPREKFQERLRAMLQRNFPRTLKRCDEFGFDISCEIAFDEVVPKSDDGKFISPSDLDVLTIMSFGMEGVFDTCGSEKDGRLKGAFLNGESELDCEFVRMKDVTVRLMQSKIVKVSPGTQKLTERLLSLVNAFSVTRLEGKVALIRGTMSGALFNIPLFWAFGNTATIGSAYGLLSDIIASDRVQDAKDIRGAVETNSKAR